MSVRLLITRHVFALAAVVAVMPGAVSSARPDGKQEGRQALAAAGATVETRHLTITTSAAPAAGRPGQRAVLNIDVAPKPKMHVYSPDQPKEQDYMPIALTVETGEGFKLEKPRYPASEKLFFAPLKETQHVYSKPFRITQPIVITRDSAAAPLTITGTVRYQACDDAICYLPQTVKVKWEIGNSR
jgi:DsbC/DsbD-like thiol-disulfide interchange protein